MSDLEQAARLALDALGRCSIRLNDLDFRESVLSAIDALRAAFAQQQAEPVAEPYRQATGADNGQSMTQAGSGNPSF